MYKSIKTRFRGSAAGLLTALVAFGTSAPASAADLQTRQRFSIPAQSLDTALLAFSDQAKAQVLMWAGVQADARSPGAQGELRAIDALKAILENTGLQFQQIDDETVAIVKPAETGASNDFEAEPSSVRLARAETPAATNRPAGSAARESSSDPERQKVEEIVVTARKREEDIQDVPISITAITADEISRRNLTSAADYLRGIPGVNQVESPFGQSVIIRGLETSPAFQNFSAGTTVATYFGETQTTNSAGLAGGTNIDIKLVDIERVEVLRGPQGTAFGGSSLGGVVRTIPVAPRLDRFEGKLATGYSVTADSGDDNYHVQAVGNIPLVMDKLAVRAVAYQYDASGYYVNRANSDPAFRAIAVTPYGAEAFAVDSDEVGSQQVRGGRMAALFQPAEALSLTLSYLAQKSETDGYALQNSGPYQQTMLQVAPGHVTRGQKGGVSDNDLDIANATLEYDFGWGSMLAAYSYLTSETLYSQPFTFYGNEPSVAYPASALGRSEHREHVGEVRLSTRFDGPWNFLVGIYGEEIDDDYLDDSLWHGSEASNFFGVTQIGGHTDVRDQKQTAAFGEITWEFLPGFTLAAGARAYDYERASDTAGTGIYGDGSVTHRQSDASGTSFRGNLSYAINDDALVYAGWSQGFRLGKPQPGLPPGLCDDDDDGIVDGTGGLAISATRDISSDEVDSYELGGKFSLLESRLVIAADVFRVEWSQIPMRVLAPRSPGCGLAYTANAGEARSEGVEVQANVHLTKAWRVDVGASHTRAQLTKDAPGLIPPAVAGDRLPGSPEFNANLGLQYEFEIGRSQAFVRTDSIYVGSFYGDLQETPGTRAGGYVKVDATARVSIDHFSVDLFVHNLTNRDDFTFRDTSPLVPAYGYRLRPRTIGLQLGVSF